ncbi:hypothetical protein BHG07_14720 [Brenneria salicis ATCC 15712 = DSM 30166]|nr:hypothetical protein BHG07_14720 [Brenneria salicis ATCC 15712 = DSM 30166]
MVIAIAFPHNLINKPAKISVVKENIPFVAVGENDADALWFIRLEARQAITDYGEKLVVRLHF